MSAKHLLKPVIGFGLAIDIIILDQLSKWWIMEYFLRPRIDGAGDSIWLIDWMINAPQRLPMIQVDMLPFFNMVMVWNEGISFGLFQGSAALLLIVFSLLIVALFSHWLIKSEHWLQAIALSMVIGGAIGNVIDRLRFGAVADFFDFYVGNWHWPAFNVADSAITLGVAFLVIDGVFLESRRKRVQVP